MWFLVMADERHDLSIIGICAFKKKSQYREWNMKYNSTETNGSKLICPLVLLPQIYMLTELNSKNLYCSHIFFKLDAY